MSLLLLFNSESGQLVDHNLEASLGSFLTEASTCVLKIDRKITGLENNLSLSNPVSILKYFRKIIGTASSFSETGIDNLLKINRKINLSNSSYNLSFNSVNFNISKSFNTTSQTFSLTFNPALLKTLKRLGASKSDYTLTGSASFYLGKRLTAASVNYNINGQALLKVSKKLSVTASSFSVTPPNINLKRNRYLNLNSSNFSSTFNSNIFQRKIKIESRIYSVSFSQTYFNTTQRFSVTKVDFSATFNAASVKKNYKLVCVARRYNLTEVNSNLTRTKRLEGSPSLFRLTGRPSNLSKSTIFTTSSSEFNLDGSSNLSHFNRKNNFGGVRLSNPNIDLKVDRKLYPDVINFDIQTSLDILRFFKLTSDSSVFDLNNSDLKLFVQRLYNSGNFDLDILDAIIHKVSKNNLRIIDINAYSQMAKIHALSLEVEIESSVAKNASIKEINNVLEIQNRETKIFINK